MKSMDSRSLSKEYAEPAQYCIPCSTCLAVHFVRARLIGAEGGILRGWFGWIDFWWVRGAFLVTRKLPARFVAVVAQIAEQGLNLSGS